MQIDNISNGLQLVQNFSKVAKTGYQAAAQSPRVQANSGGDTVATTALAKIASNALQQVYDDQEIRPEKLAQFKGFASDDVVFSSDPVMDAIYSRIAGQ